jgi:hypothetical protein
MGLKFARHAAGFLDHVGDGTNGHRQVLRSDQDQSDGGDQANFRPGKIKHGRERCCFLSLRDRERRSTPIREIASSFCSSQ